MDVLSLCCLHHLGLRGLCAESSRHTHHPDELLARLGVHLPLSPRPHASLREPPLRVTQAPRIGELSFEIARRLSLLGVASSQLFPKRLKIRAVLNEFGSYGPCPL